MSRNRSWWCVFILVAAVAVCAASVWAQEPAPVIILHDTNALQHVAVTNAPLVPVVEETSAIPEGEAEAGTGSWMIGTRVTHFDLSDDTRGTRFHDSFMGSITEIQAEQDNKPNKLFVQYHLADSPFWIGVSYDHVRAQTWDGGGSDGSVDVAGYVPYVQARWENETIVVPYIEAGLAFYKADFEESDEWSDHGRRSVDLDSSVMGREIAGGVAVQIYEGLSIDFYAQYMDVDDIKGAYYINGSEEGDAIFTMSHVMYGIGAQVRF